MFLFSSFASGDDDRDSMDFESSQSSPNLRHNTLFVRPRQGDCHSSEAGRSVLVGCPLQGMDGEGLQVLGGHVTRETAEGTLGATTSTEHGLKHEHQRLPRYVCT